MPRSLYQCFHAKVYNAKEIRCEKGHHLSNAVSGAIPIEKLAKGEALEPTFCQMCLDYDEMGPPVPPRQRGWEKRDIAEKPDESMLVSDLAVSSRTANTLRRNKLITVAQILEKSPKELLDMRWFGEGCLTDLIDALAKEGIEYAGGSIGG